MVKVAEPGKAPLDALYDAVRAHAPAIIAACVHTPEMLRGPGEPERYLRITYRQHGPYQVVWDGYLYLWASGPHAGTELGDLDNLEPAAKAIARAVGITP